MSMDRRTFLKKLAIDFGTGAAGILIVILCMILRIEYTNEQPSVAAVAPYAGPYTIIEDTTPIYEVPGISAHPLLPAANEKEVEYDDCRIFSVAEGDILKVLISMPLDNDHSRCWPYSLRQWHLHNPERRDFIGMSARLVTSGIYMSIRFADGTELPGCSQPPDAVHIGTSEWRYQMRWQRVWQDYYLVTVYRGQAAVIDERLMREENGKDIRAVLGEYHGDPVYCPSHSRASWLGDRVSLHRYPKTGGSAERYTLVPVTREELFTLSPDFPKDLIRWVYPKTKQEYAR